MPRKRKTTRALLEAIHDTAAGLHESGLIDMRRLRQYDALCVAPVPALSAAQFRALLLAGAASPPTAAADTGYFDALRERVRKKRG